MFSQSFNWEIPNKVSKLPNNTTSKMFPTVLNRISPAILHNKWPTVLNTVLHYKLPTVFNRIAFAHVRLITISLLCSLTEISDVRFEFLLKVISRVTQNVQKLLLYNDEQVLVFAKCLQNVHTEGSDLLGKPSQQVHDGRDTDDCFRRQGVFVEKKKRVYAKSSHVRRVVKQVAQENGKPA